MIEQHEKPYTTLKAIADLRKVWFQHFDGNLATICRVNLPLAGYPVGSVVPYILDDEFCPIMYLGAHAEHSTNALENPKASLFLREYRAFGNVQEQWRLCAIGDLKPILPSEEAVLSARYFAAYPQAVDYERTHKFNFFRLTPKKYRVIMGFGQIRWISADSVFTKDDLSEDDRQRIISHMNTDHMEANRKYLCTLINQDIPKDEKVLMVGVHGYGCTLLYHETLYFQPFKEFSSNADSVKAELISLSRA